MALVWMLFAAILGATFIPKYAQGSCQWSGCGNCHPTFLLWGVSPTAAREYETIVTDISKTNAEKKAALEAWASNQNAAVQESLNAYWMQRIANMAAAKEQRAQLAAYLSPEAQTLNTQLIAVAEDGSLTELLRSTQVSELMNAASVRARAEILLVERQLALIGASGNQGVVQQPFGDEASALVAAETVAADENSATDTMLAAEEAGTDQQIVEELPSATVGSAETLTTEEMVLSQTVAIDETTPNSSGNVHAEIGERTSSLVVRQVSSTGNTTWDTVAGPPANNKATSEASTSYTAATASITKDDAGKDAAAVETDLLFLQKHRPVKRAILPWCQNLPKSARL